MAGNVEFDTVEIEIAYRDIDMLGQMHNAAYLTLAEQALVSFWRQRPAVENEPAFIMKRMECHFERPLRFGDTARLTVAVDKIGVQTVGFAVLIRKGETLCARVEIVWMAWERERHEIVGLPEPLRDWLYDFLP